VSVADPVLSPTHPITLRFLDPDVETAFNVEIARIRRGQLQLGAVLLTVLYAAFGVVDWIVYPEHLGALLALRCGVVVPLLALALPVVLLERFRDTFERRLQAFLSYLAAVSTLGLLAIGLIVDVNMTAVQAMIGSLGVMTAVSFAYGATQLQFVSSAAIGGLATVEGLAYLAFLAHPPMPVLFTVTLFGVSVNIAGLTVVRELEAMARRDFAQRLAIEEANRASGALLASALPVEIALQLRDRQARTGSLDREALAVRHDTVTVLVADLVGFTQLSEQMDPEALARWLDRLFSAFDDLGAKHRVEKIKTLGDAWIAAAGRRDGGPEAAARVAALALDMVAIVEALPGEPRVQIRIGVHTGSAVAGVIGCTRYAFDLWGDAVQGAKAMESGGVPGRVRVSERTRLLLPARVPVVTERDASGEIRYWLAAPA
jgi:class 3 adenylate cyclase